MFYARFVAECERLNKAPNRLAKELGIPSSNVTRWKQNTEPSLTYVVLLADTFGVTVDYLIGRSDIRTVPDTMPALDAEIINEIETLLPQEKEDVLSYIQFKKSQRSITERKTAEVG